MKNVVISLALLVAATALFKVIKMNGAIRDSYAPSNKSGLSSVRSALQVYYGDHEGRFPTDDLASLLSGGKYLGEMPALWSAKEGGGPHPATAEVVAYGGGEELKDTGKWAYFNDPARPDTWGNFVIDCTHAQLLKGGGLFSKPRKGDPWSSF